jgi:hypothetical protein
MASMKVFQTVIIAILLVTGAACKKKSADSAGNSGGGGGVPGDVSTETPEERLPSPFVRRKPLEIKITYPSFEYRVDSLNQKQFLFMGTCSLEGAKIQLEIYLSPYREAGVLEEMTCLSNKTWSVRTNLSKLPKGKLSVGAKIFRPYDGVSFGASHSVIKMTKNPIGQQNIAFVLMDFKQDGSRPSLEELQSAVFDGGNPHSVNSFIKEISYEKTWINGDFFGWYEPSYSLGSGNPTGCFPEARDWLELAAEDINNFRSYDYIVIYAYDHYRSGCWGGYNTIEPVPDQPQLRMNISKIRLPFYSPHNSSQISWPTVAHELLHGFGLAHANAYICDTTMVGGNDPGSDYCMIEAYGDLFDIMGSPTQASHPNGFAKKHIGWLGSDQFKKIEETEEFDLYPIHSNSSKLQVVEVPLQTPIRIKSIDDQTSGIIHSLYLEFRTMETFDTRSSLQRQVVDGDGISQPINEQIGVFVRAGECGKTVCRSSLLDLTPGSLGTRNSLETVDSYLREGGRLRLDSHGITIEVIGINEKEFATIRVTKL